MLNAILADPSTYFAISFGVFLILIGRPVLKIMLRALDDRAATIGRKIDLSTQEKEDAGQFLKESEKKEKTTADQINLIQSHATAQIASYKLESEKKLKDLIEREESLAREQVLRAENQAMDDVRKSAIHMAIQATEKVLQEGIEAKFNARLVEKALDDIESMPMEEVAKLRR